MDLRKLIGELHAERDAIDQAILVLERLVKSQGKRRGRPPSWMNMTEITAKAAPKRKSRKS